MCFNCFLYSSCLAILHVVLLLWRWQLQFDICLLKSMMMMMAQHVKIVSS